MVLYQFNRKKKSYYNQWDLRKNPIIEENHFSHFALAVFDCSRQNENIRVGPIDIKITFQASEAIPAKTAAYALIIHDQFMEYNPLMNLI